MNLERELVAALTGGCRKRVAGYTVKRQYFSAEFTDGIENIGFDSIEGLNSPIFIRTVKLKDFPWNGWLTLGIDAPPDAAWNPIAGFSDRFGRLLWSAVGDPALFPAPYDVGLDAQSHRGCSIESRSMKGEGERHVRVSFRQDGRWRCLLIAAGSAPWRRAAELTFDIRIEQAASADTMRLIRVNRATS